jgi:hypothetical protein
MTNDLETRLLDARNAISELDIDETAVFARGRRLVRARRIRAASALSLLVAAGIAITPAFLPAQVGVPAGAPSVVQSEDAGGGQEAAWTVETTMDVLPHMPTGEFGPPDEPVMRIKFTITQDAPGHYALRYELLEVDGTSHGVAGSETESGQATWGTGSFREGLIVGFIDDEVTNLSVLYDPDHPDPDEGVNSDFMPVRKPDGTTATVFQMRYSTDAEAQSMDEILWRSADGRFHTSKGRDILQVDVPDTAEPEALFYIPETGHLGLSRDSAQYMVSVSAEDVERGEAHINTTGTLDDSHATNIRSGYLPAGSQDVRGEFGENAQDPLFVAIPASEGGGVFWYARTTVPIQQLSGPPLTLSWIDATGASRSANIS